MENEVLKQRAQEGYSNQSQNEEDILFCQCLNDDHVLDHLIQLGIPPFIVTSNEQNMKDQHLYEAEQDIGLHIVTQSILTYNRKEKSLSQLTKKFIEKFEGASQSVLALDQVTQEMNVERRRIYDIINIMESLKVVSKIRKNIYKWKGLRQAIKTIQAYSKGENLQDQEQVARGKKQRSLQSLATQFLKVFSISEQVITLEQASIHVLNQSTDEPRKTKVRRLYDIVNVFKCMGLVKKVKQYGEKPGYKWLGCENLIKIIEDKQRGRIIFPSESGEQIINEPNSQFQTKIYYQFGRKIKEQQMYVQKQNHQNQIIQIKSQCGKTYKQKQNLNNNQQLSFSYSYTNRDRKQTLSITSSLTSPRTQTKQKGTFLQNQSFRYLQFEGNCKLQKKKLYRTNSHHHMEEQAKVTDNEMKAEFSHIKNNKINLIQDQVPLKKSNQAYFLQILRKLGINKFAPIDEIKSKFQGKLWNFDDQQQTKKQNYCSRGNCQFN